MSSWFRRFHKGAKPSPQGFGPVNDNKLKYISFQADRAVLKGEDRCLIVADCPWPTFLPIYSVDRQFGTSPPSSPDSASSGEAARTPTISSTPSSSRRSSECEPRYGGVMRTVSGRLAKRDGEHTFSLFGIFDGHNGEAAAEFLQDNIKDRLLERLPESPIVPPQGTAQFDAYLLKLRQALSLAVSAVEADFAAKGIPSGSTVTLLFIVGDVVTVANLGDSSAWVDTGAEIMRASIDHNVGTNATETDRLLVQGVHVAKLHESLTRYLDEGEPGGVGPLRIWPGGLALSRAFGDFDASSAVISACHVTQMILPATGARFYLASDGIWNTWTEDAEVKGFLTRMRKFSVGKVCTQVMQKMCYTIGLKDDATIIAVDILQGHFKDFTGLCSEVRRSSNPSSPAQSMHGFKPGFTLPLVNGGVVCAAVDYGAHKAGLKDHPRTQEDQRLQAAVLASKSLAHKLWDMANRSEGKDAQADAARMLPLRNAIKV